ncbi:MAG: hypothetical protein JSU63_12045, partial [Phycisphaerales bacterium]
IASSTQQTIANCMGQVHERFSARASLEGMDFQAINTTVSQVIEQLGADPTSVALLNKCVDTDAYLGEHTGNVFYLSMLLGSAVREYVVKERQRQTTARALRYDHVIDLVPLGMGAMFIDLGMTPLRDLQNADRALTEEEANLLRQHPLAGAAALPEGFNSVAKMIVRTHHENLDGSGYPDAMPADQQHIFTRIIRIADAYDAATAQHVYKEAKSPARVIWEMTCGPFHRFFDRNLVRVLARLIQPFWIGTKLRLSNGQYGVVVKYNRRNPFAPDVVIAFDREGQPLAKSELVGPVELGNERTLRIQSCGDEDLSFIYHVTFMDDAPCPAIRQSLFEAAYP